MRRSSSKGAATNDSSQCVFDQGHAEWYVAEVLAHAHRFAGDGTVEASGGGCAAAASAPNETVARMVAEAARLSALRPTSEYVWGGSHGASPTPPNGPFDCSSAVSHLLQVGGFGNPTMDTTQLVRWGARRPPDGERCRRGAARQADDRTRLHASRRDPGLQDRSPLVFRAISARCAPGRPIRSGAGSSASTELNP